MSKSKKSKALKAGVPEIGLELRGSGMSYLTNYLVASKLAAGQMVEIIDIGGSYKKAISKLMPKDLEDSQTKA